MYTVVVATCYSECECSSFFKVTVCVCGGEVEGGSGGGGGRWRGEVEGEGGPVDTAVVIASSPLPRSATPSTIRLLTNSIYSLACSRQTEGCSPCAAHFSLPGCLLLPADHHPPLCDSQGQGPKMGGCVDTRGSHLCVSCRSVCDWDQAIKSVRTIRHNFRQ